MRIAFSIFKYFRFGGIQRDLLKFVDECTRRGHEVRVYTCRCLEPLPGNIDVRVAPVKAMFNHTRYERLADWVVEQEYSERHEIELGEVLVFSYAGEQITGTVTSIRKVDWMSFRPNFFILFAGETMPDLPFVMVGAVGPSTQLSDEELQDALVADFPTVTTFAVSNNLERVRGILEQAAWAIRFMAAFALAAGLLVIFGMAQATAGQRREEAALLKALGGRPWQLAFGLFCEFFVLGSVAVLLGFICGVGGGWLIASPMVSDLGTFAIPWLDPAHRAAVHRHLIDFQAR